jgi:hypothetical protein
MIGKLDQGELILRVRGLQQKRYGFAASAEQPFHAVAPVENQYDGDWHVALVECDEFLLHPAFEQVEPGRVQTSQSMAPPIQNRCVDQDQLRRCAKGVTWFDTVMVNSREARQNQH